MRSWVVGQTEKPIKYNRKGLWCYLDYIFLNYANCRCYFLCQQLKMEKLFPFENIVRAQQNLKPFSLQTNTILSPLRLNLLNTIVLWKLLFVVYIYITLLWFIYSNGRILLIITFTFLKLCFSAYFLREFHKYFNSPTSQKCLYSAQFRLCFTKGTWG